MRLLFAIIFAVSIIAKPISGLETCNVRTAKQAIPPRIHFEQTIDGSSQNPFYTRFLHNKVGIFMSELSGCYFKTIEPSFIFKSAGVFGLILWLYFAYKILTMKLWVPIFLVIVFPIFPFFNLFTAEMAYFHKIFAIMGAALLIKRNV